MSALPWRGNVVPMRRRLSPAVEQYNLVSWALNSFGVSLDDFLTGAGP
jgi:hypothetical protein